MPSVLHSEVFAAMDRGALVLTGSQRAARALHTAYAARMRAENRTVWQPPAIQAWDSWTHEQWQQLLLTGADARMILSPMQERLLWSRILTTDAAGRTLRSPESLARLAAEAWSLLATYGALGDGIFAHSAQFNAGSTDTRIFLQWAKQFERTCEREQMLPAAQLDSALAAHITAGRLRPAAKEILLAGFDRVLSSQSTLCEALSAAGARVIHLVLPPGHPELHIRAYDNEESELHDAARTIRGILTADPAARIALIMPDASAQRSRLEAVLLSELAPELLLAASTAPRPFEFSIGITLDRLAITRTALALLRWAVAPLQLAEVSELLLSPYLEGAFSEGDSRAEWDAQQLRRAHILEPEVQLNWVLGTKLPPLLRTQLKAFADEHAAARRAQERTDTYSSWMQHAARLLEAAGWPGGGDRPLNSIEYQQQQRWQEMLDEVATLDFAGTAVDFVTALDALSDAAATTLFSPESHDAPVQILGAPESAGLNFDHLLFLDAADSQWPAPQSPHPFIPWMLQHSLHMPGVDSSASLAQTISVTQRIAASAPRCIFSYARNGSEGPQRASACLKNLAGAVENAPAPQPTTLAPILALEDSPDSLELPPLPDAVTSGGAAILKAQAQCPFRAFAEHRLHSRELGRIEAGLDAPERGELFHRVMAVFWNDIVTRDRLLAMTSDERTDALRRAIDTGLDRHSATTPWQRRYLALQSEWLLQLLPQWLEVELESSPFQVIRTEHKLSDRAIGPLRLDVRVDRIDAPMIDHVELPEATKDCAPGQLIIDYKTGNIPSGAWKGDRPDEPQLPLYAVLAEDRPIGGIAIARLKVGEMELKPRSEKEFAGQLPQWRKVLTALAESFAAGDTAVDPKNGDTCRNCAQMPLCRIRETNASDEESEESDG